jgi:hypothetical protein
MKKSLTTLVFGLLISVSVLAQSKIEKRALTITNKKIEKIEAVTKLSKSEKETYRKIYQVYLVKHFGLSELKEKHPSKFKEGVRKNNASFKKKLIAAIGKKRADEIIKVGQKKKH